MGKKQCKSSKENLSNDQPDEAKASHDERYKKECEGMLQHNTTQRSRLPDFNSHSTVSFWAHFLVVR